MGDFFRILISVIITAIISVPLGIFIEIIYRKKITEVKIGSAEQQAQKIIDEGLKAAETKKKEALIEAKEEILRAKKRKRT